jgi:hypothetical protein
MKKLESSKGKEVLKKMYMDSRENLSISLPFAWW